MSFPYPVTNSDTYKLVLCRTNGGAVVPGVFTHNRNLWLLSAHARSLELDLQANTKFAPENLVTLDYENWLLEVAKFISRAAHFGATDRGGNDYYAGHITDVARRVDEDTHGDVTAVTVAYLHDIVERAGLPIKELEKIFSPEITEALSFLTRRPDEDSYRIYLSRVSKNPLATIVKNAEVADNRDETRLHEVTDEDAWELVKYDCAAQYLKEKLNSL